MRYKYNNLKSEYKGMKFDSKKELNYYIRLEKMEQAGEIKNLQRQVKFELQPGFEFKGKRIRAICYYADFTYDTPDGKHHIVDTKGMRTDVYKIKKKLMQYNGYEIEEV